MPYSPLLFLNDYPGATVGGAISATDAAIASLSSSSRLSALRQADSRRRQGQSNIYLQNTGSRVIPNLMPLGAGVNTVAATRDLSFNFGSTAYGAVNTIHRFDLTTKQMSAIGAQIVSTRDTAMGAISNPTGSFVFSPQTMDLLTFSTLTCSQVSAGLSSQGNPLAQPIAVGGTDVFGVLNIGTALSVYTFATRVNAVTGTNLTSDRLMYVTSVQSPTNGYVWGGVAATTAIQRVVLSTRVISTITATITNLLAGAGGICNATVGFSVSGGIWGTSSPISTITKLTFGTEAIASVSATLSVPSFLRHGSGSSTSGVLAGGVTNSSTLANTNAVDEFTYSGETMARLSATLTNGVGLIASSSTFSPGFP